MFTLIQIRCGEELGEESRVTQAEPPKFKQLQRFVGGPIECVPMFDSFEGKLAVAFCHEEGKLEGRPPNRLATQLWWKEIGQRIEDYLAGNIVIVQCDTMAELEQL